MATALYKRVRDNPPATSVRDDDALLAQPESGPDFYLTPNLFWQLWLQAKVEALTSALFSPLGHRHASDDITDSSALGRSILGALTAADVRMLIGAQSTVIMMSELEAIQGTSEEQRLTSPRLQQVAATTAVKKIGAVPAVAQITGGERLVAITGAPADGPSGHITTGSLWNNFLRALVVAEGNARYSALGHTHTAIQITDATDVGRQVLTASSAIAARAAIGAQEAVPAMTEQEALDGAVTDQRTVSPRVLAIGAAKHGGGGGSGLVPMTSTEAVAGVGTDPRSVSPAVLRAGIDARIAGAATTVRATLDLDGAAVAIDPRITFTRAGEAWGYNAAGVLTPHPSNVWREEYSGGVPQGRAVYPVLTNKLLGRNANPIDLNGVTGSTTSNPDLVLELVNDQAQLVADGLGRACSTGNLYRASIPAGSTGGTGFINFAGSSGNANPHAISLFARGSGVAHTRYGGQAATSVPIALGPRYVRHINLSVPNSSRGLQIGLEPGAVVYFILQQLIEAPFAGPVIPGDTLSATQRAPDMPSMPVGGWYNPHAGTVLIDFDEPASIGWTAWQIGETNENRIVLESIGGGARFLANADGAAQGSMSFSRQPGRSIYVASMQAGRFVVARNGAIAGRATSGAMPQMLNPLYIARFRSGTNQIGGQFRRLRYWPAALQDSEILSLSRQ